MRSKSSFEGTMALKSDAKSIYSYSPEIVIRPEVNRKYRWICQQKSSEGTDICFGIDGWHRVKYLSNKWNRWEMSDNKNSFSQSLGISHRIHGLMNKYTIQWWLWVGVAYSLVPFNTYYLKKNFFQLDV